MSVYIMCVPACARVRVCVRARARASVCVCVRVRARMRVHVDLCIYVCRSMYVYMNVVMRVSISQLSAVFNIV